MIKWQLPWSYHFKAPIGTCENEAHKFDLKTISLVGRWVLTTPPGGLYGPQDL